MVRCYECAYSRPRRVAFSGRQLHLGASDTGELILLREIDDLNLVPKLVEDYVEDRLHNSSRDSLITKLPAEILNAIFSIAISCDRWFSEYYTCALALSRVCKLFHRTIKPLLFRNIELSSHHLLPSCRVISNLHRTLKQNPETGTFCKSVDFCIQYAWWSEPVATCFVPGVEILRNLPNVTSIKLTVGDTGSPDTWLFVKNGLRCMPRIRNLELLGIALPLAPIYEIIQILPQLQSLTLDGITKCSISPTELERTTAITRLELYEFYDKGDIDTLCNLINLPMALEHFQFDQSRANGPTGWDLSIFQRLLHNHRASLKSIYISDLAASQTSIGFLSFPKLETLHLSRWICDLSPHFWPTLLTPRLHTFIWDFNIRHQHSAWSDFGVEQKERILGFAEAARAQKSVLRKIRIEFNPDAMHPSGDLLTKEQLDSGPDPWRLLYDARESLRSCSIELSYDKPSSSWGISMEIMGGEARCDEVTKVLD